MLSWMRVTGDREVTGLILTRSGNIFWQIDQKIFSTILLSRLFKTDSCQFLVKESAQCVLVNIAQSRRKDKLTVST